jgi:hypothetical protein
MLNRPFKNDEEAVDYGRKLEGKTMKQIFSMCGFARPTDRKNLRSGEEPIRQFIYKEERGDLHCSPGCKSERRISGWYQEILDGDGNLTSQELKVILDRLEIRKCRICCHDDKYYKITSKCPKCKSTIQGNKGSVGNLIDCYFGYASKTESKPDLEEVGIELKSRPLVGEAKGISIKEPMSLNLIPYNDEIKSKGDIRKSSWYKKCSKMLLFYWEHRKSKDFWEWKMKDVFLWKVGDGAIKDMKNDYEDIVNRIENGVRCTDKDGVEVNDCSTKGNYPCETGLHQKVNCFLTTCPKHSGKPAFKKERKEGVNAVEQPRDVFGLAEKKAFRIKTAYELRILSRYRKANPEDRILDY